MIGMPGNRKLLARLLALSGIGVEMVGPAIVGVLIDRNFGTSPWGIIVGAVLGFVGAMIHLVSLSQPRPGEDHPEEDKTK